jgi:hypothetical protein
MRGLKAGNPFSRTTQGEPGKDRPRNRHNDFGGSTSSTARRFNAVDLRDGWCGRGKVPPCTLDREKKLGQDLESDVALQLGIAMPPLPSSPAIS